MTLTETKLLEELKAIVSVAHAYHCENGPLDKSDWYQRAQAAIAEAPPDPDDARYIKAARAQYHKDGEIEIDDGALVSRGDDPGAYVQAWVWVSDEELEDGDDLCDTCGRSDVTVSHTDREGNTVCDDCAEQGGA
jgi:hypothetical protein